MRKLDFSSADLPAELDNRSRFDLWREIFAWRYGAADITPLAGEDFAARSEHLQLNALGVVRSRSTVQRFRRTSRQASDGTGAFLVAFNRGTSCTSVKQHGREQIYEPGRFWLGSTATALDVQSKTGTSWVTVILPASQLLEIVPNADDRVATQLEASPQAGSYLRHYLELLLNTEAEGGDPILTKRLEDMLLDLIALTLGTNDGIAEIAKTRGLRAARIREILAKIQEGFSSPDFSAQAVADALGLSARYVQELMQETGVGFTSRVLELRLQKARAMLSNPVHDRLKISDLAYACGFNEVSYFNRCFRRRFGASPTQYRA